MSSQIITKEGYEKMQKELDYLKNIKRPEIAERIQRAKEMGDLNENAEYAEAKETQAFNDGRIAELMQMLKIFTVVENGNGNGHGKISMGSRIVAEINNIEKEFVIVSFNEADPLEGKISNESPLGKAFLNKKAGDMAIVETPKGIMKYKIKKVI